MKHLFTAATSAGLAIATISAFTSAGAKAHSSDFTASTPQAILADTHAPIGVMGDHRHKQGEWMMSYRFMRMSMKGNLRGSSDISAKEIINSLNNPFPGPEKVRVVPTRMTSDMHMLGLMYAPSDQLTLMAMFNYLDKDMQHSTYAGMSGSDKLGKFSTRSSGIGDTKVSALWGLMDQPHAKLHLNLGLSLPTGSIDETATALAPTGMRMKMRMPYAMQLGSGTYDLQPGITYNGYQGQWAWGSQYLASLRLGENDEDYSLGDKHELNAWGSYRYRDGISASLRLNYQYQDEIDGADPKIHAPVQGANPDNYGGETLNLALGVNLVGQSGLIRGHRLAIEYQAPIYQDVNGVQMDMQSMLTLGYQYAF